ncbi:MAG: hypothetical protein EOP84_10535 [Verrucomicrobiaceae bacterium]|nr:MAG: hypothetical protein EOP84_10535 [Verrucomicrobiaceae bacterium]
MTTPRNPRTIVPDTKKRDTIIAIIAGLVVLAFVITGIVLLSNASQRPSTNQLTGVIVAKNARGEVEREIRVGRKGLASQETDTGYSFDIRVEKDNRTYTVPVSQQLYEVRQVGDKQSFIRPPSEQR